MTGLAFESGKVQFHRGTAAALAAENKLLDRGEPAAETDTGAMKVGPGRYNDLPYTSGAAVAGLVPVADLSNPASAAVTNLKQSGAFVPLASGVTATITGDPADPDVTLYMNGVAL